MSRDRLVMLGTDFNARGGVTTVIRVLRDHGLFERWPVVYLTTSCDGGALAKLSVALRALLHFMGLLLANRVAALHSHTSSGPSLVRKSVFIAGAMLLRVPVIFHLHGGRFAEAYDDDYGPLRRCWVRFVLNHSARVIVLSSQWQRWVERVAPRANVMRVLNPAPPIEAVPAMRDPNCILFLGRITGQKGIYELLEALPALRRVAPAVRLVIAGDGEVEAVARRAAELGVADAVSLPGWVEGEAKARLLCEAGIYVLPSYFEGLPMGLLEAMGMGLPVVVTRVGGMPDAVSDGREGFVIAPQDVGALAQALQRLLTEPALAARMGEAGRATIASRFSVDEAVGRIELVYRQLGI